MAIGLQDRMSLYIFGDKHYPPFFWFMTSHKENQEQHSMLELLYNHKHKKRRLVVENAFGMNKQNFKELLKKIELDVTICA
jgi:hypothetical protein